MLRFVFLFFFLSVRVLWFFFFFSSRRRHTISKRDWSSDVCSSDLRHRATKVCPAVRRVGNGRDGFATASTRLRPRSARPPGLRRPVPTCRNCVTESLRA